MNDAHLIVNFPDFPAGDTVKCAEDGSLKMKCEFDNGNPGMPDDTFPCCHLSVTVGTDRKQCSYSDNETCTILLTVAECSQGVNVFAYPHTATVDASSQSMVTRSFDGKYTYTKIRHLHDFVGLLWPQ